MHDEVKMIGLRWEQIPYATEVHASRQQASLHSGSVIDRQMLAHTCRHLHFGFQQVTGA